MKKSRVFLDTSILITALLSNRGGSFYILTQLKDEYYFQANKFVLEETLKVIENKFINMKGLKNSLFLLLGIAKIDILSNPSESSLKKISGIINKEDAPILISALQNSDYLLTLDKDFLTKEIKNFTKDRNLFVLTPKEFIYSRSRCPR